MKVGKAGKAAPHAAYIAREGQYAQRLERGEKLEATEAGNMPAWAQVQPQQFWQAADAFERVNGTTYREMEIALPRELEPAQRAALVRAFVIQEIGERHAYQWAIHTPTAADGGEQPHAHLMFSERQCDGIDRDPGQYFKRYNAKAPDTGGARKGYGPSAGQTLSAAERADELKELRGRWQALCNAHLERAGQSQRIDMRSYADQGLRIAPERKQLPSQWRGQGKAQVIELRAARREAVQARRALQQLVPDLQAEVISLDAAERYKRFQQVQQAGKVVPIHSPWIGPVRPLQLQPSTAEAEKQRLQRMDSAELAAEIYLRRLPSVDSLVEQDRAVMESTAKLRELHQQKEAARSFAARADMAHQSWREQHPAKAKLHDKGLWSRTELERLVEEAALGKATLHTLQTQSRMAEEMDGKLRRQVRSHIVQAQSGDREALAEIEQMRTEKYHQERAVALELSELQTVSKAFSSMAAAREMKALGWGDSGSKWRAAPEPLKKLIDGYNAAPKDDRDSILECLRKDPGRNTQVRELLSQQQQAYRERDRGLSR